MHSFVISIAARAGWFAEGRFLGRVLDGWSVDAEEFTRNRLPHLLMVAIIGFVLSRLLRLVTARMIHVAEQHAPGPSRVSQVKTLAGVIRTTGLAIIGAIVGLQALAAVGIDLAPLLASAGVAGIALGLAAQNIVRDMLNGMLILIEDQFNVGDTVRIAGLAGTVEAMTLRKTTVRDADGTLYVIPNSQITTVANLSVDYSVATINVSVDFSANPDQVTRTVDGHRHGDPRERRVQRPLCGRPADSGRGCNQRLGVDLPGGLQDARHEAVRAGAGVPPPRAACARRAGTAARRSQPGLPHIQ